MESCKLCVVNSRQGNWVSCKNHQTYKYEIKLKRSVLESKTPYKTYESALKAGERMVKSLGFNRCSIDSTKQVWSKV